MQTPHVLMLIGPLGTAEILFILVLVLLLFGAQKIPDLARSLGKAQREFNRARQELEETTPAPANETEDDKVRKAAKDLGIDTVGKDTAQLREAIADRMKT